METCAGCLRGGIPSCRPDSVVDGFVYRKMKTFYAIVPLKLRFFVFILNFLLTEANENEVSGVDVNIFYIYQFQISSMEQ